MFSSRLPEFIANHAMLVGVFVALLIALISHEIGQLMRGYKAIGAAELTQLINRQEALVVDVSAPAEFAAGHVPGARHVPMTAFDPENKELAKAHELPIVVYCKSGTNSAQAATRLAKAGFKKVHWLDGGIDSWKAAEMPVVKGKA